MRGWFLHTRGALLLTLAVAAAGCGRLGFDPVSRAGEDGGEPGDGGTLSDSGSVLSDGGTPATRDTGDLTYLVTTEADESDAGETGEPPHLGTGLSLREAIQLSNGRAGRECIHPHREGTLPDVRRVRQHRDSTLPNVRRVRQNAHCTLPNCRSPTRHARNVLKTESDTVRALYARAHGLRGCDSWYRPLHWLRPGRSREDT